MISVKRCFGVVFLSCFLSACLVPERFSAKVDFHSDASYTFNYSGITAYTIAISQPGQSEQVNKQNQAILQADADKMLKRPEFKRVEPMDNGRYNIDIEYNKKAGESLKMFDVFSVTTDDKGVITVSTTKLQPEELAKLSAFGIEIDGALVVTLPDNAVILEHNASSTPYFFGWLGDYEWKITSFDQQPVIKFKIEPK